MAGQHASAVDVNAKGFLQGLAAAFADFKLETEKGTLGLAIVVENRSKDLCPVDTGRLRSSIAHQEGRDAQGYYVDVGTSVHYAPFVEFGTSSHRAQPFLRPAVAEAIGFGGGTALAAKAAARAARPRRR